MNSTIQEDFTEIGARVRITTVPTIGEDARAFNGKRRMRSLSEPIRVNIVEDAMGQYFDLRIRSDAGVSVLDVQANDRHLLLSANESQWPGSDAPASNFLCGFDERAWFGAAIPQNAFPPTVQGAKDALKPPAVWESIRTHGVPMDQRDQRRTKAFIRQGEWFFIPRPDARINPMQVLRDEPIQRGASRPHICDLLYQSGGERVRVCSSFPNGLTDAEFEKLSRLEKQRWDWHLMTRGACVYVRGIIRHPDHNLIWLDGWHEVVMNTENQARSKKHLAFLD